MASPVLVTDHLLSERRVDVGHEIAKAVWRARIREYFRAEYVEEFIERWGLAPAPGFED